MDTEAVIASMQKAGGPVLGELCGRCKQHHRVAVTNQTLGEMIDTIHPVLHSISKDDRYAGREYHAICPNCDAYALGANLAHPFPFLDVDGETKTINDTPWW